MAIAFLINGFSFLAVILAYAAMREEDLHAPPVMARPRSVGEVRSQLAEGLGYVRRTDLVLLATVTVGVVSTFGMNFGVTIPALADQVLHTDATGYGFLMTATGIGSLVAALGIAFSGRSRPLIIPLGAVVLGIGLAAAAVFQAFALTILAMMLVGLGAIAMAATANTTIQLAVPDELRGRVISVYTTVFVGSTPLGGLLMGWIASAFGVPASLAVAGVGSLDRRAPRPVVALPDPGAARRAAGHGDDPSPGVTFGGERRAGARRRRPGPPAVALGGLRRSPRRSGRASAAAVWIERRRARGPRSRNACTAGPGPRRRDHPRSAANDPIRSRVAARRPAGSEETGSATRSGADPAGRDCRSG